MEDTCRAEAAISGRGVHPNLNLVWRGPAEVRQHRLVSVTLRVMALIFTAALLWHNHTSQLQLQMSGVQPALTGMASVIKIRQHNKDIFFELENVLFHSDVQAFSTLAKRKCLAG